MHTITYCSMIGMGVDNTCFYGGSQMLTYLICLSVQHFLKQSFENKNLFSNIRLDKFLNRGAPTGKFQPNRLLKTRLFSCRFWVILVTWATEPETSSLSSTCQRDSINNPYFYCISCFVLLARDISYLEHWVRDENNGSLACSISVHNVSRHG